LNPSRFGAATAAGGRRHHKNAPQRREVVQRVRAERIEPEGPVAVASRRRRRWRRRASGVPKHGTSCSSRGHAARDACDRDSWVPNTAARARLAVRLLELRASSMAKPHGGRCWPITNSQLPGTHTHEHGRCYARWVADVQSIYFLPSVGGSFRISNF
jgi:hypothetical protein